jgi:hypothetical protein
VQVLKRKVKDGVGIFPVDAPVQDATVNITYSLHWPTSSKQAGACVFNGDRETPRQLEACFTTGEGFMASGMEMALKLMLPGEQSEVFMDPQYGFATASEVPEGAPTADALAVCLALNSFEKEGHPQAMDADQVCGLCCLCRTIGELLVQLLDWSSQVVVHVLPVPRA